MRGGGRQGRRKRGEIVSEPTAHNIQQPRRRRGAEDNGVGCLSEGRLDLSCGGGRVEHEVQGNGAGHLQEEIET